jgi:hypothetical protein
MAEPAPDSTYFLHEDLLELYKNGRGFGPNNFPLPREIILMIIYYLDIRDIGSFVLVCKQINNISKSEKHTIYINITGLNKIKFFDVGTIRCNEKLSTHNGPYVPFRIKKNVNDVRALPHVIYTPNPSANKIWIKNYNEKNNNKKNNNLICRGMTIKSPSIVISGKTVVFINCVICAKIIIGDGAEVCFINCTLYNDYKSRTKSKSLIFSKNAKKIYFENCTIVLDNKNYIFIAHEGDKGDKGDKGDTKVIESTTVIIKKSTFTMVDDLIQHYMVLFPIKVNMVSLIYTETNGYKYRCSEFPLRINNFTTTNNNDLIYVTNNPSP